MNLTGHAVRLSASSYTEDQLLAHHADESQVRLQNDANELQNTNPGDVSVTELSPVSDLERQLVAAMAELETERARGGGDGSIAPAPAPALAQALTVGLALSKSAEAPDAAASPGRPLPPRNRFRGAVRAVQAARPLPPRPPRPAATPPAPAVSASAASEPTPTPTPIHRGSLTLSIASSAASEYVPGPGKPRFR